MLSFVGYYWFLAGGSMGLSPCLYVSVYLFVFLWGYGWAAVFLACGLCVVRILLGFFLATCRLRDDESVFEFLLECACYNL